MSKASTYVRELYAITQAVARWRHYLLGRKFTIRTDHRSLKELMSQVIQTPEQQYYLTKLLGYEFDIVYRAGKANAAADSLSRLPADLYYIYTQLESVLLSELRDANTSDPELLRLYELQWQDQLPPGFSLQNGLILYEFRFYIPQDSPLVAKVIHEFHATPQGGHMGTLKTYKRVAEQFY